MGRILRAILPISIVCLLASLSAAAPLEAATLKVSSFPSGAQVIVDGVNTGKLTPMNVALSEGDHIVTVQIPGSGWSPDTRTVSIVAGNNDLSVTLLPMLTTGPQGPKGDKGDQGIQGPQGIPGTNGTNGINGQAGAPGTNGIDGTNGTNGSNGMNGTSVTISGTLGKGDAHCPNGGLSLADGTGTSYLCNGQDATTGATGGLKVYDSTEAVVGSWVGFLPSSSDGSGLPSPISYVLLTSPGSSGAAMVVTNYTGDDGSGSRLITPGLYGFVFPIVFFTGASCDGTAYMMTRSSLLPPAAAIETGSPLKTQVWAPKTGGARLSEGNPATNPASPLLSALFKNPELPLGPASCTQIPAEGLGFDTGPLAEAMIIVSDLAAAWVPPFRIGQ